ncbi:MAG: peptide chain release factor N(5)-glutamine methyltransferase [Phycisphaerales bacterium]|jgi:release factor glutamine methyltransferase|nr:peptide chain release factor N(5)-glutamine methyltransferase [Phycisphaerales bacterium]
MSNESTGAWTVLKLLEWTKKYFADAEVDQPRLCAEVLLAHTLKCQRIELYTRFDYTPSPDELTNYRQSVKRASQHEPTAYLVGSREFYSVQFKVTKDVLIPRPETEQLVAEAEAHLKTLDRPGLMWDICTGSGCVAIATALQVSNVTVLASDICPQAVAVAQTNAETHSVADRVSCGVADLVNIPENCPDFQDRQFDVITVNPPYVGDNDPIGVSVKHEPPAALFSGPDGLNCIRKLLPQIPQMLLPGGMFALEFGAEQHQAIIALIADIDQFDTPIILKDHQDIERTITVRRIAQ